MAGRLKGKVKAHADTAVAAGGLLQRKCACGKNTAGGGDCNECGRRSGQLQRMSAGALEDPARAPDSVDEALDSAGSLLDARTRTFMESRLGHDFSGVRVHTDAKAAEAARDVHARAFTVGSDIVFAGASPARDPFTLAHELTHVVQQSRGLAPPADGLRVAPRGTTHEREADRVALGVLSGARAQGGAAALSPAQTSIQRDNGDPAADAADEEKPPHKMVPLSTDPSEKHVASDAVVSDFQAASDTVKGETGVDLTLEPSDTLRRMSSKTDKPGASNFSWHKTGRAIDLNQGHKWLIVKEPAGDRMQFRIYLEKTSTTAG
ncbi:MAG TPA: DUF4157 domain-containing protein, partial [Pyrinomonadaceae bacterium]